MMDGVDFSRLPEGCISHTLSLTYPRETCRASLISSAFRSAAESDVVWKKFLPSDYQEILSRSVYPVTFSSKKELYFRLYDPFLIDEGKKSCMLEKSTGKKCFMLCARELSIIWGNDQRYWRWTSHPASRFSEVAELRHVCWLEINGKIETRLLSPKTTYTAYLVMKFVGDSICIERHPLDLSVEVGTHVSNHTVHAICNLVRSGQWELLDSFIVAASDQERIVRRRDDGWLEIELGDFFNEEGENGAEGGEE